jgi:YbbR domain-containing protein
MFGKSRTKLNQRLVIFLFFLIVSTLIWYLSKLSHEYSTNLSYPIRYESLPKGKVLVGEPLRKMQLKVKAFGYTLLKAKMSAALSPIELDLNKHLSQSYEDAKPKYFVLTYRIRSSVAKQLGSDILLEGIEPDTLFVEMAEMVEKKVPVEPLVETDFERQFMQSGSITIEPEIITLSGPKSILDTILKVKTNALKLNKLNQKVIKKLSLQPIHQVSFSSRTVTVNIPVEKYTELTVNVPVEIENQPDSLKLMFIPKNISVKCNVVLSRYFSLKPRMFKAVVDYRLIANSLNRKLKVRITMAPDYITLVDFEPKYVEYIIEKR